MQIGQHKLHESSSYNILGFTACMWGEGMYFDCL